MYTEHTLKKLLMNKQTICIKGMHCHSCELLVESELLKLPHVEKARVSQAKGTAEITYSGSLDEKAVENAVQKAGYSVGISEQQPWVSRNPADYVQVVVLTLIIGILALVASDTGITKVLEAGSSNLASFPVVFLIGLTAGVSTCAALVGGLVLGVSARYAEQHPNASSVEKFRPHIFFNIGRVVSFGVLGGVMGAVGSLFQMSLGVTGFFTILIGLAMVFFGLQLIGIFPRLSTFSLTLPTGIARRLGIQEKADSSYSDRNALVLGALTFFLPCGFTQMVQLYAISTANPLTAALTMGIFALGTAPGLLGIGALTSAIKGTFSQIFYKGVGVVVVLLALYNIVNGLTLSGIHVLGATTARMENGNTTAIEENGVQVLKTTFTNKNDIQPSQFTVKAGVPVRFEVEPQEDGFGCMASMALPGLSEKVEMLKKGNIMTFEFTPEKPGTYQIACAMGVPRGTITVL